MFVENFSSKSIWSISLFVFKALQEMLPTIMSQMGMTTDFSLAGEGGQRKGGARADQSGEGPLGTISEQAGDDDVPGKSKFWEKTKRKSIVAFLDLVENFDDVSNSK